MANEKHIKIIMAGADAISTWRDSNPGIPFDLQDANLKRVDLKGKMGSSLRLTLAQN